MFDASMLRICAGHAVAQTGSANSARQNKQTNKQREACNQFTGSNRAQGSWRMQYKCDPQMLGQISNSCSS